MTNDMPETPQPQSAAKSASTRRIPLAIGAVVVGALIVFAGVYGVGGFKRGASGDSACNGAVSLAQKIGPLAHGGVAALTMATTPLRLPELALAEADGQPL